MFNNIPNDEQLTPNTGENNLEDGMSHVNWNIENRLEIPIKLVAGHATFEDITTHAKIRQRLGNNTIKKNLRYARFMETYNPYPVNLIEPSFENFMQHMDYREQTGATESALRHEWDSMKMFLKAYGMSLWNYKPPRRNEPRLRMLPFPELVHKFFHHEFSTDKYENAFYRTLFKIGFLVGCRPPSELSAFKTSDIHINSDLTGGITVTEVKKRNKPHPILPNKQINKIFINYIDHWRPKVENQYSDDKLFLWKSGKPVTTRLLGHKLSEKGKMFYPSYRNYDMRHWCAIARLIETKVENGKFDELDVCDWLGHDDVSTTMAYIKYAKRYYAQKPFNWMKRVLKFYKNKNIEKQNSLNQENTEKPWFRVELTDKGTYGGTGIYICLQKGFSSVKSRFSLYRYSNLLLKLFFSFFIKIQKYWGMGCNV